MHTARYAVAQGRPLAVARPSGKWAEEQRSSGNLVLTDPAGCAPEHVYATDKTDISRCADRQPYADVVLRSRDDLPLLWTAIDAARQPA
jgi:hypothetical protein